MRQAAIESVATGAQRAERESDREQDDRACDQHRRRRDVLDREAASATPVDCPRKNDDANSATAVPRVSGAICVALICSVLCSM